MAAFVSPVLRPGSAPSHARRQVPVCVLNEERTTSTVPRTAEPKRSAYYRVVEDGEDVSTLPPPPPRHYSVPLVGYVLEHYLGLGNAKTRTAKYGALYRSNFLLEDFTYVNSLPVMHDILRDTDAFRSDFDNEQFNVLMGDDNILMLDGERHKALRSLIAPAFSQSMFPSYFDAIVRAAERLWRDVASKADGKTKVKLDPLLRRHYMSIVIEMTSGVEATSELCELLGSRFMSLMYGFLGPAWGPLWDRTVKLRNECVDELHKIVVSKLVNDADVIEQLRAGDHNVLKTKESLLKGLDIMHVALAESGIPTGPDAPREHEQIDTIVNLVFILWFAGFFTSAATTACAVFEMGMEASGDIARRLAAEQDALVAAEGPRVTLAQVNGQMPLLNSYIAEIMRLFPAGDGIARVTNKDVVMLGKTVKRDTKLFFDLKAALRDEAIYPQPDKLIIDRFVDEPGSPPAAKNVVFGDPKSPHYCVGAALAKVMMKTTFAVLLREYRLDLDPQQSPKYNVFPDLTPQSRVVVRGLKKREA